MSVSSGGQRKHLIGYRDSLDARHYKMKAHTHVVFLCRGSYGPRIDVGKGQTLPSHKTKLKGLYRTGDYSFPGKHPCVASKHLTDMFDKTQNHVQLHFGFN